MRSVLRPGEMSSFTRSMAFAMLCVAGCGDDGNPLPMVGSTSTGGGTTGDDATGASSSSSSSDGSTSSDASSSSSGGGVCGEADVALIESAFVACEADGYVGQIGAAEGATCAQVCCVFDFGGCTHRAAQFGFDGCAPEMPKPVGACEDVFEGGAWSNQCVCR